MFKSGVAVMAKWLTKSCLLARSESHREQKYFVDDSFSPRNRLSEACTQCDGVPFCGHIQFLVYSRQPSQTLNGFSLKADVKLLSNDDRAEVSQTIPRWQSKRGRGSMERERLAASSSDMTSFGRIRSSRVNSR